jgi:hypothetical protein
MAMRAGDSYVVRYLQSGVEYQLDYSLLVL